MRKKLIKHEPQAIYATAIRQMLMYGGEKWVLRKVKGGEDCWHHRNKDDIRQELSDINIVDQARK